MATSPARWTRLPARIRALAAESAGSILLETSRFDVDNHHSYLFQNPISIIAVHNVDDLPGAFTQIESALGNGLYAAGFFSYECGYHFEDHPAPAPSEVPFAWIGVYREPIVFDHAGGDSAERSTPKEPMLHDVALEIARDEYSAAILKIKEYIAAGETYQVNFTDAVAFDTESAPGAIFESLQQRQSVAYGAWLNVAGYNILSFSPELFFRIDAGKIVTRPMKGTMPRGLDIADDAAAAMRLRCDEKNRSEHVMIVDLLRNDLGRICTMGSVCVEDIFSVESYETLLQMTSTVSGTLRPGMGYYEIFRAMFPSGSITGAPKIRTMQLIRELERKPRGVYTGAIGFFAPNGTAAFNVAIRTLVMKDGRVRMGVGGGIVADSDPASEYNECLLKAAFLTRTRPEFELIETMLWDGDFRLLPLHMDRLESSAAYFHFNFDRGAVLARLHALAATFAAKKAYRVRLLLNASGEVTMESAEFLAEERPIPVRLSPQRTSSTDVFLRHKTTQRRLYDEQYTLARAEGFDEVLFLNERGEVTEGAISNLFIERDGRLLTPPVASGLLPGVFRRHLLETDPRAEEQVLTLDDLRTADAVYLCNSLRGLRRVDLTALRRQFTRREE
ncbi:MAG TPA: aminodeoxychorismate synthase component I [Acidobacteriaceae bacterium]